MLTQVLQIAITHYLTNMGCMYHTVALSFIYIKKYLKAKEKIMETQIFHHEKNIIFKKSFKQNQIP
jgi:hypothetical protein